jgi:hypothetical protein
MRTKALEWVKHPHANLWRADCLTGRYQVYAITSPITYGFDGFDGLTEVFGESPTEEAAKAAAQSHFDAAIASVLEDDWQTMETAPRDGTNILLAEDGVTSEAYWSESGMGWWAANTHHTDYVDGQIYAPTHWRPLPSPPKAGE